MKPVSVKLPKEYIEGLKQLVVNGFYANTREAIRFAIRDLLVKEGYSEFNHGVKRGRTYAVPY
ncbi:MAG: ribbon-helix-helix domain-containing protein [Candidatus Jordarchaeum sp.]|uniref:ribbon-helix-helix domain-containing protein n=1 Tax=Candidatus Jordarchaeum sp. TaxID=2823881 RepID=UPI00404AF707